MTPSEQRRPIHLLFVGDTALKRTLVDDSTDCSVSDLFDPWWTALTTSHHLAVANLEAPLAGARPALEKAVALISSPDRAAVLKRAGFGLVSIANNHIRDAGCEGLADTVTALDRASVMHVGIESREAPRGVSVTLEGRRLLFLAASSDGRDEHGYRILPTDATILVPIVSSAARTHEDVIVLLHWGIEHAEFPRPDQRVLARALIDAGARAIVGSHPHRIQGIEHHAGRPIFYSLGDFQFPRLEENAAIRQEDLGVAVSLCIRENDETSYDLIPVRIDPEGRPRAPETNDQAVLARLLSRRSRALRLAYGRPRWYSEAAPLYLKGNAAAFRLRLRKFGPSHLVPLMRWLVSGMFLGAVAGLILRRLGVGLVSEDDR